MYDEMKYRLREWHNKCVFIRQKSADAADLVPNGLDFLYIDGNHMQEYVEKDIKLYYPKVRRGGMFGGHNYQPENPGVMKAVYAFFKKRNLTFRVDRNDWWVIKP